MFMNIYVVQVSYEKMFIYVSFVGVYNIWFFVYCGFDWWCLLFWSYC